MIAAAFLVLLRPYSIQCALFLLLLLLGTIATIVFFCCWHRKLQKGRHPMKSVFSGRSRSRDSVERSISLDILLAVSYQTVSPSTNGLYQVGFRASPRHIRRRTAAAAAARLEEVKPVVEVHHQSEQEISVRKRRIKKNSRVQPEFYHSVQGASTRRPSSGNASYRCSMSSSADFSDEDDFSQKSGSASPAPGDTLPWNLPKHERSKRKIHGGSVLDPAERAVLRIAGKSLREGDEAGTRVAEIHPSAPRGPYLGADALCWDLCCRRGRRVTVFTLCPYLNLSMEQFALTAGD
ncbi:Microtubule-actin cross-linking factor 1, isoforms 1/2/3/5 [Galemys pyrenaicus]|uniref:Microtubule-actin cross-linking factor 1, isoforms 1/2/3/5 n=1 Tax=Galemys pyrenaicus TaxID=202257 RepID=A0A8J6BP34_GALPY|nr:Microtubule-actin cross-linking factor 1, isoforms 1/2/3/5 [Galemys pyrenaicus]